MVVVFVLAAVVDVGELPGDGSMYTAWARRGRKCVVCVGVERGSRVL